MKWKDAPSVTFPSFDMFFRNMLIISCKKASCKRYKKFLYAEKNMPNYLGFWKVLAVIIQYSWITLWQKITSASISVVTVAWKKGFQRPNFLYEKLFLSCTLSYTITKNCKNFFASQKSLRFLKLLRGIRDMVLFRFFRVLFGVFRDKYFFRVLSDRFLSWVFSPAIIQLLLNRKKMCYYVLIFSRKLIAKNMEKHLYDANSKFYNEKISHQFSDL